MNVLDRAQLPSFLGADALQRVFAVSKAPAATSDIVRIELLKRWGGVWVDATAMCAQPLDTWLHERMSTGFFAFERPVPERMLASWFLAATPSSYIASTWHARVTEYWKDRSRFDDYFWFHQLFAAQYEQDAEFRTLWDRTAKLSARHSFHFGPNDSRLFAIATPDHRNVMGASAPVFKLTHKLSAPPGPGSLFNVLCLFGKGEL